MGGVSFRDSRERDVLPEVLLPMDAERIPCPPTGRGGSARRTPTVGGRKTRGSLGDRAFLSSLERAVIQPGGDSRRAGGTASESRALVLEGSRANRRATAIGERPARHEEVTLGSCTSRTEPVQGEEHRAEAKSGGGGRRDPLEGMNPSGSADPFFDSRPA
jgi:hypothetical protein